MQDPKPQLTGPLPQVMQVSATMETVHIETFVEKEEIYVAHQESETPELVREFPRNSENQTNLEKESKLKVEDMETSEPIPEIFRQEEQTEKNQEIIIVDSSNMETSNNDILPITSDVFSTPEVKYLIRIDKEEFSFADDEKSALAIINSLAIAEIKKLANPNTKVFRQDLHDGKEVRICTQALGYVVNGRITKNMVIDVVCVPRAIFVTKN